MCFVFIAQNGETPLKLAVERIYKEIVHYLVEEVNQDITTFDQVKTYRVLF